MDPTQPMPEAEPKDGYLIGGARLRDLIDVRRTALAEAGDQVRIFPCARNLADHEQGLEEDLITKAFSRMTADLQDKQREIDKFVSIRIHASRTVWRQRWDAPFAGPGDGTQACLPLDQVVTQFWAIERCYESRDDSLILEPGECVVIPSLEEIMLPPSVYGFLQSRTTVGVRGLDVTPTNVIVPGFSGCLHMLVRNNMGRSIQVPDMHAIGELYLFRTVGKYSGAGPEFHGLAGQELTEMEPAAGRAGMVLRRSLEHLAAYTALMAPILATGYFIPHLVPGIAPESLGAGMLWLWLIASASYVVAMYGKDIAGFVMDRLPLPGK